MAFINKNDFSIVNRVIDNKMENDYFECDDLIAPAISLLNRKGYKTLFCCSGHPYATIDWALTKDKIIEADEDFEILFTGYSKDVDGIEDFDIEEYPYYVVHKCFCSDMLYVSFEDAYNFNTLPGDSYIDNTNNSLYWDPKMKSTNDFDVMLKIFQMNQEFYKWVEKLDSLI